MAEMGPSLPPGWATGKDSKSTDSPSSGLVNYKDPDDYGPMLPPALMRQKDTDHSIGPPLLPAQHKQISAKENSSGRDAAELVMGPALPPHLHQREVESDGRYRGHEDGCGRDTGPILPPHLQEKTKTVDADDEDAPEETFGAKLPPDYSRWNTFDVDRSDDEHDDGNDREDRSNAHHADSDEFGPALPPGFKMGLNAKGHRTPSPHHKDPVVLPGVNLYYDDDDNDDDDGGGMIGPMPMKPGTEAEFATSAGDEFERRSRAMKDKLESKDKPQQPQRESWMTELPGYSTNFGLGPRTFRKTALPDVKDRSEWTDTPADKARKEKEKVEKKQPQPKAAGRPREESTLSDRDKRLSHQVEVYNQSKRGESLVDMHSKARKRKLEAKEQVPRERRPFSRESDLQVNRFDEAQRKNLIKKSAELNSRFSHSSDKVYL